MVIEITEAQALEISGFYCDRMISPIVVNDRYFLPIDMLDVSLPDKVKIILMAGTIIEEIQDEA